MPPALLSRLGRFVFAPLWMVAFVANPVIHSAEPATSSPAAVQEFSGAVALQNRGEYDLAADAWSDFLEKRADDPLAPKARHYRGVCRFQLQQYADARADFEHVIKNTPQVDLIESTHINLGLSLFNLAQAKTQVPRGPEDKADNDSTALFDQAIATFKTQLEKFPDGEFVPLALYYQAEALYARQKRDEAIAAYQKFIASFPDHALRPDAFYGLGIAQADSGNTVEAGKTFQTFLDSFTNHPLTTEVTMRLGDILFAQGKQAEAESHFAAAAAIADFEHADYALLRQAACRFETNNFTGATELYKTLYHKYPKSPHAPVAALNAGKAMLRIGNHADAILWFQNSLATGDIHAAEASHWLARAQLASAKPADALATVEAALSGPPPEAWAIPLAMDRADALYAIPERRSQAIAAYTKIADDHHPNPQAGQALYLAADTALAIHDYQQALELTTRYLKDYSTHAALAQVRHIGAEAQLQLKQYDAAINDFRRLLEDFPQNPSYHSWRNRLALAHSLAGQHQEAIELLTPHLGTIDQDAVRAESELLVGAAHLARKEFNQAIPLLQTALDRALTVHDTSLVERALLQLARAQHGMGNGQAAIDLVERLLAEYPKSRLVAEAQLLLAEFFAAAGNDEKATEVFEQFLVSHAESSLVPSAMLGAAGAYSRRGVLPKAIQLLDDFITQYPGHRLAPDAFFARAVARQKTKNYPGAIEDVAAFLAARPEEPRKLDALYVRGLCQASQKQYADAMATYESILADNSKYTAADQVLYEMAWIHRELGDSGSALETFKRLTTEHPNSPLAAECHYRVGEAAYTAKDYTTAADSYRAARAKAGGGTELAEKAQHKLAWTLYEQGDFSAAAAEFAAQLAESPTGPLSADAKYMRGEALFKQNQFAEALTAIKEALDSKPSSDLFRIVGLLHAGQAAGQLEQWDTSLQLLNQCTGDYPNNDYRDEVDYERGWALHKLGRDEDAIPLFAEVSGRNTTALGARSRFMIGEIQMGKKDYNAAVRTFFEVAYGYKDAGAESNPWKANAMFDAARCLEQLKKQPSATKIYQELIEKYPESEQATHARNRLQELNP
ncbi:MAG: tetratricopeptide repeat protein [Pirellulales bacterium]|nr:tetratricopeptide repeat protein [Pirellulales bacterium]